MGFFSDAVSTIGRVTGLSKGSAGSNALKTSKTQKELRKMLLQRARGKGTSVAELQLQQAQQQAQKKLMGALSSQRSRNVGLAQREALRAGAEQQAQVGQQAAILRAQEQQAAQQTLSADLASQQQARAKIAAGEQQAQTSAFGNMLGAAGTVGAAAIAASDENCKTNIKSGEKNIQKFLDNLKGMSYNYKEGEGENPKDKNIGVMAQDLEKTPEGDAMVDENNGRKEIDFGKGFNAMLAAMSHLNEKLKKVDNKKGIEKIVEAVMKKKKRGA